MLGTECEGEGGLGRCWHLPLAVMELHLREAADLISSPLCPVPVNLPISFSHPALSSDNESHLAFLSAEDRWNWLE